LNTGDSYSAPPLDSYAPGKYEPSFLKPQPQPQPRPLPRPQPPRPQFRPQPPPPQKTYLPQRPVSQGPRPQYVPPIPMKLLRPQAPPVSFRPQGNSHAQSIAHGYASGQSHSQGGHSGGFANQGGHSGGFANHGGHSGGYANQGAQAVGQLHTQSVHSGGHNHQSSQSGFAQSSHSSQGHSQSSYSGAQGHSQSIHSPGPIRHQPKNPLPHRAPVPQGLFQSIGQHVQALDNGHRDQSIGNTYLPPPVHELPIPPMKLSVPNPLPAQPFLSQHQSHSSSGHSTSSGSAYSYQNQELRNVHIIHDCGKGPQLSQSYGTPLGEPLESYEPQALQLEGLSSNYDVPSGNLEVPQHNQINFNSPSNSYGPPASGPASLDVIGLESQQRSNTIVNTQQDHLVSASSSSHVTSESLPGLSSGLSGLNFISAQKSHSIEVPTPDASSTQYQLQFTTSQSDQNSVDPPNHQQILADGLLNSILSAIEKQPGDTVPQVKDDDQENDHSEVKVFLKSPTGQEVLADKPAASHEEHASS
jgi:hypothetical protein